MPTILKQTMRITFTIGILLIGFSVFGQEFGFDIHNTALEEYIQMEEKLGSERIPTTSNHVSFSGDAQPIKFKRKEEKISDLIAFYYFKEEDSTMSSIKYEWDVYNFEKQQNNQKPKEFQEAFISKYKGLKENISADYGIPKVKRNYSNISRLDSINTFVESSTWKPNDSTEIEMYATVSNYYEKRGASTINPVHRIRLYVRNQTKKKEPIVPKLDEKRLDSLVSVTSDFMKELELKNTEDAKRFLSDLIKEQVTAEQIALLSAEIDFERETELVYSGIQMGLDGSAFTILQFKYSDDKESPPKEIIKVVFDEDNLIVGLKPMKIQN